MRLDYTMYALGILLLILTIVPFIVEIPGVDENIKLIWVISSAVLGLISFGLGYSQQPKTQAQACENDEASCKDPPKSTIIESEESQEKMKLNQE